MKNVVLEKGRCGICSGPISKDWAGEDPSLGTRCEACTYKKPEPRVFGPENVTIAVTKQIVFDPVLGVYEYHFDWAGTQIMVNGEVGTIKSPQGDGDFVQFPSSTRTLGTFIKGVGYWSLLKIYKEAGGETEPPVLSLPPHKAEKAILLDEPIADIELRMEDGVIYSVQLGKDYEERNCLSSIPFVRSLHAFANMYVRNSLGLSPNFCFEGGFAGSGFEIRNLMGTGSGVGISVRMPERMASPEVKTINDLLQDETEDLSEPYVAVALWIKVMKTFLLWDWSKEKVDTISDVWQCYCHMQDVLLNIMEPEELELALAFAHEGRMVHCGSSF